MARRAHSVSALAAGLVMLAAAPGLAVEWRTVPSVTAAAGSDTNLRMSRDDAVRAAHANIAGSVSVEARDAGFTFRARPEVVAQRYADSAEDDRNNYFTTFELSLAEARQSFRLGGSYARESTLTSEFERSGFLGFDVERTQRSLFAGFDRALGPGRGLDVSLSATDVGYGQTASSPFGDYGQRAFQSSYSHAAWRLSASHSLVDSTPGRADHTSTALKAVWTRRFSPVMSGEIGFGAFAVDDGGTAARDPSASFSFAITRDWARWTLRAGGDRDVRPETSGVLTREDTVSVETRRNLRRNVSVAITLRGVRAIGATGEAFERDYSQLGASVSWRATERLSLYAGVFQRMQDTAFTPRATGRAGIVSVTFGGA